MYVSLMVESMRRETTNGMDFLNGAFLSGRSFSMISASLAINLASICAKLSTKNRPEVKALVNLSSNQVANSISGNGNVSRPLAVVSDENIDRAVEGSM